MGKNTAKIGYSQSNITFLLKELSISGHFTIKIDQATEKVDITIIVTLIHISLS